MTISKPKGQFTIVVQAVVASKLKDLGLVCLINRIALNVFKNNSTVFVSFKAGANNALVSKGGVGAAQLFKSSKKLFSFVSNCLLFKGFGDVWLKNKVGNNEIGFIHKFAALVDVCLFSMVVSNLFEHQLTAEGERT